MDRSTAFFYESLSQASFAQARRISLPHRQTLATPLISQTVVKMSSSTAVFPSGRPVYVRKSLASLQFGDFAPAKPASSMVSKLEGSELLSSSSSHVPKIKTSSLNPEADAFLPKTTAIPQQSASGTDLPRGEDQKSSNLNGAASTFHPGTQAHFEFDPTASTFVPETCTESTLQRSSLRVEAPEFVSGAIYSPVPNEHSSSSLSLTAVQRSNLNVTAAAFVPSNTWISNHSEPCQGYTPSFLPNEVVPEEPFESFSYSASPTTTASQLTFEMDGSSHSRNTSTNTTESIVADQSQFLAEESAESFAMDELDLAEAARTTHLAALSDAVEVQYIDCKGKPIYYQNDELEEISPEQEVEGYRRVLGLLDPFVHHYNWLNQGIYAPSTTKPATSLAIIMSTPKHNAKFDEDALCHRKQLLIKRAFRWVDPVVYTGDHEDLKLRGSALENAAIGCTFKFYSQHGNWDPSEVREDDDLPEIDSLDADEYNDADIIFNGATIDCNFPTLAKFRRRAAHNLKQEMKEAQQEVHLRREAHLANKFGKSSLSQVWRPADLEYDSGFDWADEAEELADLPAVDYSQVVQDLCKSGVEVVAHEEQEEQHEELPVLPEEPEEPELDSAPPPSPVPSVGDADEETKLPEEVTEALEDEASESADTAPECSSVDAAGASEVEPSMPTALALEEDNTTVPSRDFLSDPGVITQVELDTSPISTLPKVVKPHRRQPSSSMIWMGQKLDGSFVQTKKQSIIRRITKKSPARLSSNFLLSPLFKATHALRNKKAGAPLETSATAVHSIVTRSTVVFSQHQSLATNETMYHSTLRLPPATQALFADFSGVHRAASLSDFSPSNANYGGTPIRVTSLTLSAQESMRLSTVPKNKPALEESLISDEGESALIENSSTASPSPKKKRVQRNGGRVIDDNSRDDIIRTNRLSAGITVGSEVDITTLAIDRVGTEFDTPTRAVRSLRNLLRPRNNSEDVNTPALTDTSTDSELPTPETPQRTSRHLTLAEALACTPPHASSTRPQVPILDATLLYTNGDIDSHPFSCGDAVPRRNARDLLRRSQNRVSAAMESLRTIQRGATPDNAVVDGDHEEVGIAKKKKGVLATSLCWVKRLFKKEMNVLRH